MHGLEGEGSNTNGSSRPFSTNGSNGSGASPLHKAALSNSTNGTRKGTQATNGSSHSNRHSHYKSQFEEIPHPTYFGHDREEVTRILIQSLMDLGYTGAAGTLSQESGYELESPSVAAFRNAVLQGEWAEAEDLLFGSTRPPEEGGVNINGNGLLLADGADPNAMRFWLRQQKFLEHLEERDTSRALMVLRTELSPLNQESSKLHLLSSLLMCQSTEDLMQKAEWDGARGQSRYQLLSELSRCISPSIMIPQHRLAVLLQQVKQSQISNCLYHNTADSPSLYSDHMCNRDNFPLAAVLELANHNGEVWEVKFSHDGKLLASCGSDGFTLIYDVQTWGVLWRLSAVASDPGTANGICSVAWSPDDTKIVTCGQDRVAKIWASWNGQCIKTLPRFGEPVSSCVWAPDGRTFITGCLDKEMNLVQWSDAGDMIYDWHRPHRIQDIAVSPNGNRLIAMDVDNHIHVYNFMTRDLEYTLDLKIKLTSITISNDSRYLLVSRTDGEVQLWDLELRGVVRKFMGAKGGDFVIKSCFGGANESFVVSGSEDGFVWIWHKENGTLVEKLGAHGKGCCSAISWNPANPGMFASAGDDSTVRIWSNTHTTTPPQSASTSRPTSSSHRKHIHTPPNQPNTTTSNASNNTSNGQSAGRAYSLARLAEGVDQQQLNRLLLNSRNSNSGGSG